MSDPTPEDVARYLDNHDPTPADDEAVPADPSDPGRARLNAAAPEMLATLRRVLTGDADGREVADVIAKATGRESVA